MLLSINNNVCICACVWVHIYVCMYSLWARLAVEQPRKWKSFCANHAFGGKESQETRDDELALNREEIFFKGKTISGKGVSKKVQFWEVAQLNFWFLAACLEGLLSLLLSSNKAEGGIDSSLPARLLEKQWSQMLCLPAPSPLCSPRAGEWSCLTFPSSFSSVPGLTQQRCCGMQKSVSAQRGPQLLRDGSVRVAWYYHAFVHKSKVILLYTVFMQRGALMEMSWYTMPSPRARPGQIIVICNTSHNVFRASIPLLLNPNSTRAICVTA